MGGSLLWGGDYHVSGNSTDSTRETRRSLGLWHFIWTDEFLLTCLNLPMDLPGQKQIGTISDTLLGRALDLQAELLKGAGEGKKHVSWGLQMCCIKNVLESG